MTHPQLPKHAAAALTVLAVLLGYVTCGNPPENCRISVVTYNAALSPLVYGYEQRRSAVAQVLPNQACQDDFLCLQEVWFETDLKEILDNVEDVFPYHYSAIHSRVGKLRQEQGFWESMATWKTIPCSWSELASLNLCFAMNCLRAEDQQQCTVDRCQLELQQLPGSCRACISMASVGPLTLWRKCADITTRFNRVNAPGLVVLSKKKLIGVDYVNFHYDALVERGYITAQVENGPTYVCTHLTAVFPQFYDVNLARYNNYLEMQTAEILQLNLRFSGTDHILLGDLNTGPERGQLTAEAPASYDMLTQDFGYRNPYLLMDGRCTYCHDNAVLTAENKTHYGDLLVDHVMLSQDFPADVTQANRVLDQPMLSDHYGVQMVLDLCAAP